jgi:hypothetical protein
MIEHGYSAAFFTLQEMGFFAVLLTLKNMQLIEGTSAEILQQGNPIRWNNIFSDKYKTLEFGKSLFFEPRLEWVLDLLTLFIQRSLIGSKAQDFNQNVFVYLGIAGIYPGGKKVYWQSRMSEHQRPGDFVAKVFLIRFLGSSWSASADRGVGLVWISGSRIELFIPKSSLLPLAQQVLVTIWSQVIEDHVRPTVRLYQPNSEFSGSSMYVPYVLLLRISSGNFEVVQKLLESVELTKPMNNVALKTFFYLGETLSLCARQSNDPKLRRFFEPKSNAYFKMEQKFFMPLSNTFFMCDLSSDSISWLSLDSLFPSENEKTIWDEKKEQEEKLYGNFLGGSTEPAFYFSEAPRITSSRKAAANIEKCKLTAYHKPLKPALVKQNGSGKITPRKVQRKVRFE